MPFSHTKVYEAFCTIPNNGYIRFAFRIQHGEILFLSPDIQYDKVVMLNTNNFIMERNSMNITIIEKKEDLNKLSIRGQRVIESFLEECIYKRTHVYFNNLDSIYKGAYMYIRERK